MSAGDPVERRPHVERALLAGAQRLMAGAKPPEFPLQAVGAVVTELRWGRRFEPDHQARLILMALDRWGFFKWPTDEQEVKA